MSEQKIENRVVIGGKVLKGGVTVDMLIGTDRVPQSFGPCTRDPHSDLELAFEALDCHCAAMLFRANSSVLEIKKKKGEITTIAWKDRKGADELWEGDNWHTTGFSISHSKRGDIITLSVTETLANGKAHNSNVPAETVGAEGGYEYIDDLLQKMERCKKELLVYIDTPNPQQELDFGE